MKFNIPVENYLLLGLFGFDAIVILIFAYLAIFKPKKIEEKDKIQDSKENIDNDKIPVVEITKIEDNPFNENTTPEENKIIPQDITNEPQNSYITDEVINLDNDTNNQDNFASQNENINTKEETETIEENKEDDVELLFDDL